jgi:hypothetical protein
MGQFLVHLRDDDGVEPVRRLGGSGGAQRRADRAGGGYRLAGWRGNGDCGHARAFAGALAGDGLSGGGGFAGAAVPDPAGDALGFVLAMVLLNIGSTAIIIRCSGLASALGLDPRFRVFVAATHNLGMSAGPALGSGMLWVLPDGGLLLGAGFAVVAGVLAVIVAWVWPGAKEAGGLRHYAHWAGPRSESARFVSFARDKGLD